MVDATYFGLRKEDTSWCVVVFRDQKKKENIWWTFSNQETKLLYLQGRIHLEKLGYKILSVTGDGFSGIRKAFSGIPFQMCHTHMKRLVVKGTTNNPQLEAGKVLLALTKTLHKTNQKTFQRRFAKYHFKYSAFLNEKTINPETGTMDFTHRGLKQAFTSLENFRPYLFTYEEDKEIPNTSNSIEGHFSHIKEVVAIHRGLSRSLKEKVLSSILLASSIAPTKKKLDEIL